MQYSPNADSMNQYFGTQYSQEDLQRQVAQRRHAKSVNASPLEAPMGTPGIIGGDSLDDIIMQNSKELQRRQSMPHPYGADDLGPDRRSSMMEFGSSHQDINSFQFGAGDDGTRRQSVGDLDMSGFANMTGNMGLGDSVLSDTMQQASPMSMNTNVPFGSMTTDMLGDMMAFAPASLDGMDGDASMNMFYNSYTPTHSFSHPPLSRVSSAFSMPPMLADNDAPILGMGHNEDDFMTGMPGLSLPDQSPSVTMGISPNMSAFDSPLTVTTPGITPTSEAYKALSVPVTSAPEKAPEPMLPQPSFQNVYSSSGFDMLGALMRVATRKNPEINIGAVDLSCAFVVCDVTQEDCPIVYVSDIFERLTGYNKHEALGRNCRFLQAPDGKVMTGVKRKYVDDDSVWYLKRQIMEQKEAQRSLINYRKGGQPFMNLLTMIPITWDTDKIRYFVGFQVDLVEQPGSVAGKGAGGSYNVNYSQSSLPRYTFQPPEIQRPQQDSGQTMSRDEVSAVLASFNTGGNVTDLAKRMWDKALLENTDDVVHVLSLKGLFLYLSPSSQRVLEYDASELVGTALSSVCHPSDIVPVTRELKDTSTGATVNVVFRIRRKKSGYTWFESHGSLCVEQGKGRKCIILVGRERPVYALSRLDVKTAGGFSDQEIWAKLSTSGMFLFVSNNVRSLLDRQSDDLAGTSIQALMRSESKAEFGRCLERARTGKTVSFKHEIMNKRGQGLQAQTIMYPGDAVEGTKPTFLVAQTKLLKPSRAGVPLVLTSKGAGSVSGSKADARSEVSTPLTIPSGVSASNDSTPIPVSSSLLPDGTFTQAGGGGLPIGSQDVALASENNIFDELKTTRSTSWQFELRQMEKSNRLLHEELQSLLASKKKRKRRKGSGNQLRDCANCHTRSTPEWRRGPSGQRDLCNSCGLRWAKQVSRDYSDLYSPQSGSTSSSASP
jgi:PAS domain S-box-containing protein